MKKSEPPDNIVQFPTADPRWIGRLGKTASGGWHSTLANALIILAHDPQLAKLLAFNALTGQALVTRSPPPADEGLPPLGGIYPRPWESQDVSLVQAYMQRIWTPRFTREPVEQAMFAVATQNEFHPVRDWLAQLEWDGVPRLDTWLCCAFGVADNHYHALAGAKFLIAAVRRVRQPGCKFDHMLILEGAQQIGKSSACRKLFGDCWFSDSIPLDLGSRDAALSLAGPWCIEFAEIDSLLRSETETIKAFLSRQTDRYRPPYGRNFVDRPRQCMLIGTTNSDDYLRDSTGNRRFWPVKCAYVDLDWIMGSRAQLWAEAAAREAAGEALWLHEEEAADISKKEQEDRLPEDPWIELISNWLDGRVEVALMDVLRDCLQIPIERQGRREELRIGTILRRLGWQKFVKSTGPKLSKRWRKNETR